MANVEATERNSVVYLCVMADKLSTCAGGFKSYMWFYLYKNVLHSDVQACLQTFDAYVVGKEDAPGIVVLQEWWGVDFEIKNHALRISQINANFKVGVTGYCMGGALAIASSVLIPEVDAVVAFYGVPSPELADPSTAKAPVQAHFGELDSFVGFADITAAKSLEEKLKLSGVPSEVHIYTGVGHAFMNASPDGVKRRKEMGINDENEDAAELAWSRFSSWMSRYLSP
ncbi:DLH domain-containing protein [Cinnamomum micranthum f. kanehirae]|uniref:DLH domain-containing protein n=1 Tax=Cinnamomum micranthum f. kanehirae TaxID=337451 RepID=A0A3S3N660_9MAGN|nr:DLH domain-containing protein [Cinnamomum micranthum f. kanehirae]